MSRWVKCEASDAVRDTHRHFPPITAWEVLREKRARSSAISVHPPGAGAAWPWDSWLTAYALRRAIARRRAT